MTLGAESLVLSRDHYGQIVKIPYFFSSRRSGGAVDKRSMRKIGSSKPDSYMYVQNPKNLSRKNSQ